jgi:thiamine-phosphate diphosphorylase
VDEKLAPLCGFYAIVDPDHCGGRDPAWVAKRILAGGCALLQLRSKRDSDDVETMRLGERLASLCRGHGVPFVVNDSPALALELHADILHLGQDDVSMDEARQVVGSMPIGLSTHNQEQAQRAVANGANLIGFGPVFATSTKDNPDPVVGIDGLRDVCRALSVPIVAIGGIDTTTAPLVARAGARLAAAISAVCQAEDPAQPASKIHAALLQR